MLDRGQVVVNHDPGEVFWLTGFTYPSSFLTGLLQYSARKLMVREDRAAEDACLDQLECHGVMFTACGLYFPVLCMKQCLPIYLCRSVACVVLAGLAPFPGGSPT